MAQVAPNPELEKDKDGSMEPLPLSLKVPSSSSTARSPAKTEAAVDPATRSLSFINQLRHAFRYVLTSSGWYDSAVADSLRKLMHGRAFAILSMFALFFALFLNDIFVVAQVNTNIEQDIILSAVCAMFLFEFLGRLSTDASYLLGFFFWMDVLGTFSMIFDISFLWGMDATKPEHHSPDSGRENLIVVRAARATKLGARAGRLSRVLKLLRFLPFVNKSDEDDKLKMARVISNQLTNVTSTRVAFLSICIVIVLPFLGLLSYPELDNSMGAWVQLVSVNVLDFGTALADAPQANVTNYLRTRMDRELGRLARFYEPHSYGPFAVCYGKKESGGDRFACDDTWSQANLHFFSSSFKRPKRNNMVRQFSTGRFMVSYDLSTPKQLEAVANMGLICFIVIVMCVFGLLTSKSISDIALKPLERMLGTVTERCGEIFKYTHELEEVDESQVKEEDVEYDDFKKAEASGEFALLERVVKKLTAIAHLTMMKNEPQVREGMGEDEIMTLNWMQGAQVQVGAAGARSISKTSSGKVATTFSVTTPFLESADKADALQEGQMTALNIDLKALPPEVRELMETNLFDCFLEPEALGADHVPLTFYTFKTYEGCDQWLQANVQESYLFNFIEKVNAGYNPNPWHNYYHALDVLHQVSRYMHHIEAHLFLSEISQFWVMVAAIGHDLGHIGVNNQFLVETAQELALRYNDRSPLENMHCARLFQVVGDPQANIFAKIEKDQYKEMRKGIIAAILHTDVIKHNEMVKDVSILYQMNSDTFDAMEPNAAFIEVVGQNTQLVLNMLLHGADMSNPMRPWSVAEKYSYLIMDEFFLQGDMEKDRGIPVQALNDREKINTPNAQIGFIEFMIFPLGEAMVNIFAPLDMLTDNLGKNISSWCSLWIEQTEPTEDATSKVKARVEKVQRKCEALKRTDRAKYITTVRSVQG